MALSTGFEEGVAGLDSCGAIGGTYHRAGRVTCPIDYPHLANGVVTDRVGHAGLVDIGVACMHAVQTDDDAGEFNSKGFDIDPVGPEAVSEDEGAPDAPSALPLGQVVHTSVHYYVDVSNNEESAYQACDRNVPLDPGFQEHLQEECEARDISTFLALPEIILARQRRRQQPLLDLTKSKILTSHTYTKSCERVLAQKEATQAEAKRKGELQKATKETRRREKEEHQLQVRARKEARSAKKQEKVRSPAERRLCGTSRSRNGSVLATPGSPPRTPDIAAYVVDPAQFPPRMFAKLGASTTFPAPNPTGPPASFALPAFHVPGVPQIPWPQDSSQPSPPFWNNPLLGMPHMFQHPFFFHHNGNSPWAPHISMPGTGDIRVAPNFQGVQLLAEDVATSGSHRHGVGTWQGTYSGR